MKFSTSITLPLAATAPLLGVIALLLLLMLEAMGTATATLLSSETFLLRGAIVSFCSFQGASVDGMLALFVGKPKVR